MIGPREWAPKEEPAERVFDIAGLKIQSKRTGQPGLAEDQELYEVVATAPDGMTFGFRHSGPVMDRYSPVGHLDAALGLLMEIEGVKRDPKQHQVVLEEVFGLDREEARRATLKARVAANSFDKRKLDKAVRKVSDELQKVPSIQRKTKAGWDELMKRWKERGGS